MLAKIKRRFFISFCLRGQKKFWLITIARMNNEHSGSFTGSYKAKTRVNVDEDYQVIAYDDLDVESDSDKELMDIDSCLSAFVTSGFDFKTLEQWDKTKKT